MDSVLGAPGAGRDERSWRQEGQRWQDLEASEDQLGAMSSVLPCVAQKVLGANRMLCHVPVPGTPWPPLLLSAIG